MAKIQNNSWIRLKKNLYRDGNSSSGEQIHESEANAFAAAILMPQKLILQELEKYKSETNIDFISSLAKNLK